MTNAPCQSDIPGAGIPLKPDLHSGEASNKTERPLQ